MMIAVDPVGAGLVASLAHPGGNTTGVTFDVSADIWGKRLELLREAAPEVVRVAVLWNPAYAPNRNRWKAVEEAARKLNVTLIAVEAQGDRDIENWFALMAKQRVRGLFVLGDPVLHRLRSQIADLALKHRLASVSPYREGADAGGLIAYGVSIPGLWRQAALYGESRTTRGQRHWCVGSTRWRVRRKVGGAAQAGRSPDYARVGSARCGQSGYRTPNVAGSSDPPSSADMEGPAVKRFV